MDLNQDFSLLPHLSLHQDFCQFLCPLLGLGQALLELLHLDMAQV